MPTIHDEVYIKPSSRNDSDSFYSSIYQFAKEEDLLLGCIFGDEDLDSINETTFIFQCKHLVLQAFDEADGYDIFKGKTEEELQSLKSNFKKNKEIDESITIYIIKQNLKDYCKIELKIYNEDKQALLKEENGYKIMPLYRGIDGIYKYFSFQVPLAQAVDAQSVMEQQPLQSEEAQSVMEQQPLQSEEAQSVMEQQPLQASIEKAPCDILYDPCSGKPLEGNTIQALEKRIREIRNMSKENPEIEYFPDEIKTRLDLLIDLLNKNEPPSNSLFKYTINGQLYEAYWDIVFALSLLDDFQRTDDFYMINKKAELISASESEIYMNNPIEYLKGRNVNEGASGASDITFCYKNPEEIVAKDACSGPSLSVEACEVGSSSSIVAPSRFYFCSSKFYKKDASKSAESFDIQKIYTAVKKLHSTFDVRIILLVKDKNAVDTKLKNARNKYISEEARHTYGEKDLFSALLKIYNLARQKIPGRVDETSLKEILGISEKIKPILSPRLHQHMAILKIQKGIERFKASGGINKFLVGILPRGGKTYIAGGIVSLLQPKRIVVLLGAKSETISQFTNDLFRYYQDFSDYEVVDLLEGSSDSAIDPSKKYIFVMSVELYKTESSKRRILIELKSGTNRADLFICDEAHLKQTTQKAIKELEEGTVTLVSDEEEESGLNELGNQISIDVPIVFMTGTYIKPLTVFKIPDENVAIWEYQDIQAGKNIVDNEDYFKENFPGIYEEALAKCFAYGETYESIQNMYRRFPNLYLLSTQFTESAKLSFLNQPKDGFPLITHLFQVKKDFPLEEPSLWHTGFTNSIGMARLINYLSPRNEIKTLNNEQIPEIDSVMTRIDRISQRIGDRLAFFTKEFVVHSQLWFLPTMQGHPLIKRMCALAGILFQSPWYRKHFNILGVSSSADWSKIPQAKNRRIKIGDGTFSWACPSGNETLKACILREEADARAQGKGLVIFAQNMLHLGISLTCVDIVVLLDAGEKVDERIQKMYRALTESTNKKGGFIIDLNYFRTVTAIMNYQIQASKTRQKKEVYANSGLKEAFNSIIETYSIDDDLDIYSAKEEGGSSRIESETIPELQRMMQKAPRRGDGITISEVGAALNRNIENTLKDEYSRGLDYILGEITNDPEKKLLREHSANVGVAKEEKDENESKPRIPKLFSNAVEKNPIEKRKAFMDIFKTTLKIGVFGTEYRTVEELINGLRGDEKLREVVYDTLVKRGAIQDGVDPGYVNSLIIKELELLKEKKGDSYKGMKEAFNSRDARSQKFQDILEYIKDNLTPKDKERHKFGEVFTPLTLVDEMLSKLPPEVWTKKDYKWLDPANGIGNFPIKAFMGQTEGEHTYPGLFEGLRKEIPDDAKRCKWIVENILYMIDINGKNNAIAKRLFEKLCPGAKANIEKIDAKNGFLTDKPLVFNGKEVKEFDIVMGNPPYQSGAVKSVTTNATRKMRIELDVGQDKHKNLWAPFVKKSIDILHKHGYLLLIHPIGWFKPDEKTKTHDLLLSNQIIHLRIYFKSQAKKLFEGRGEISVSYYLLKKEEPTKTTQIINIDNKKEEVLLNIKSLLCLKNNSVISKIQRSKIEMFGKSNDYITTSISQKTCENGTNKQIHRITDEGNITFVKTANLHKYQKIPKIILNGSKYPRYVYDKKGEYGLIGSHQHYFIGDNLDVLEDYFKTKLSAVLLSSLKYDMDYIEPKYYPDVRTLKIDKITDETLADYFGFTKEEREAINATEYPKREYKFKEITCAELKKEKEEPAAEGGSRYNKTRKLRNR